MLHSLKIGYTTIYIREEKGNLSILNKKGEFAPIKYSAYLPSGVGEPFLLRDYMMMTGLSLVEAAKRMDNWGVVLIGKGFSINFFDEESVERFINVNSIHVVK